MRGGVSPRGGLPVRGGSPQGKISPRGAEGYYPHKGGAYPSFGRKVPFHEGESASPGGFPRKGSFHEGESGSPGGFSRKVPFHEGEPGGPGFPRKGPFHEGESGSPHSDRRPWQRTRSSDSDSMDRPFTRSVSQEDQRSRSSGQGSPGREEEYREGEAVWDRPRPPRRAPHKLPSMSPAGHKRSSPEIEEGEAVSSDDDGDVASDGGFPQSKRRRLVAGDDGSLSPPPVQRRPFPAAPIDEASRRDGLRLYPPGAGPPILPPGASPPIHPPGAGPPVPPGVLQPPDRQTRAGRKRSEEELAPIAKRLRERERFQ